MPAPNAFVVKREAVIDASSREAHAEEILVEAPRLLGVAAAVRVVVQPLDHQTETKGPLSVPENPSITSLVFAQLFSA